MKLVELETECQAKDNTIAALTTEIQEKSNQICSLQENNKHILLDLGSLHTNYLESEQNLKNLNNKFQEQKILIKCQRTEIEKLKAELNSCGKVDMFSPPENDNNEESEESSPSALKKRITDLEVELKMKNSLLVESTTIRENMEEEFSQSLTAIEQENDNEILKIKALYHDKIHKLEEELRKIKRGIVFDSNQDFNHKSKEGEAAFDSIVSEKDEEYVNNVDILMNNVSKWSFHELDKIEEQSTVADGRTDNSGDKAEEKISDSVIAATDDDSKKDRKNSGDSGIHTDDDRGQHDDDNSRDIKIPADDSDTNIQTVIDQTFPGDFIQVDKFK